MTSQRTIKSILTVLVLAVCLLCQSNPLLGKDKVVFPKLGPIIAALMEDGLADGELIPIIIQFELPSGLLNKEEKANERANIVSQSGSHPIFAYLNFAAVSAETDRKAIALLEHHPFVSRISYDHMVEGSLHTTAPAVGADQAWMGTAGNSGVTGSGITVAVLDSGISEVGDLSGRVLKHIRYEGSTSP